MSKKKIDGMTDCLVCPGKVQIVVSEHKKADRVYKCRKCGAEFGLQTEEGYIEDVTGSLVREVE